MSQTFPVSIRTASAADHAAALGVMGLLSKPSLGMSRTGLPSVRAATHPQHRSSNSDRACAHSSAGKPLVATASAIETGLFEVQGEFLLAQRQSSAREQPGVVQTAARLNGHGKMPGSNGPHEPPASDRESLSTSMHPPLEPGLKSRAIAQRFLRLSDLDPSLFDRLGRYEARLWRQAAQTIWTLDALRRPPPTTARRSLRKPIIPFSRILSTQG